VHWTNPTALAQTLDALQRQTVSLKITVIDNDSPAALAPAERPGVELVRSARNEGYGPALNRVLEPWLAATGGGQAVICPHDALPRPDCVERILEVMRARRSVGIASAEYGDGTVPGYELLRGYKLYKKARGTGFCPAEYPNGTLFVVSRECLREIGLFDPRYFAYGEEYDLGRRALEKGYEVGQVWGAIVENPGQVATSDTIWYLNLRNGLLASRQRDGIGAAALRSLVTIANGVLHARRVDDPREPPFGVRLRAVKDFWSGRFGPPALP
jgi:GT2 family glycosyltransferase